MSSRPFVSYAQNGEDVVLFRALGSIADGRYVDVGANDPVADSVTYAFYERNWTGITIDPMHAYAERLRTHRPRDLVVEAAVSDDPSGIVTLHQIADTGLSTLIDDVGEDHRSAGFEVEDVSVPARRLNDILSEAGWSGRDIHLIVIDTEGAEKDVLNTIDLKVWRPWILVVEATRPQTTQATHHSWEPLLTDAGYRFCLFDGLSRFYVAQEKFDELGPVVSAPANVLDNYIRHDAELRELEIQRLLQATTDLNQTVDGLREDVNRLIGERDALASARETDQRMASERDQRNTEAILQWRTTALRGWGKTLGGSRSEDIEALNSQIALHLNHIRTIDAEILKLRQQVEAVHHTVSWRVTKPLRLIRGISKGSRS